MPYNDHSPGGTLYGLVEVALRKLWVCVVSAGTVDARVPDCVYGNDDIARVLGPKEV